MTPERIEQVARLLACHPRIRRGISDAAWLGKRTIVSLLIPEVIHAEKFTPEEMDAVARRCVELYQEGPVPERNEYRYPLTAADLYDWDETRKDLQGRPLQIDTGRLYDE